MSQEHIAPMCHGCMTTCKMIEPHKQHLRHHEAALCGHLHERLRERRNVEGLDVHVVFRTPRKLQGIAHNRHALRSRVQMRVLPWNCSRPLMNSRVRSRMTCLSAMSTLVSCACSLGMLIMTFRRRFYPKKKIVRRTLPRYYPCNITLAILPLAMRLRRAARAEITVRYWRRLSR